MIDDLNFEDEEGPLVQIKSIALERKATKRSNNPSEFFQSSKPTSTENIHVSRNKGIKNPFGVT